MTRAAPTSPPVISSSPDSELQRLFLAIVDLPTEDRDAFLDREGVSPPLRHELDRLLAADRDDSVLRAAFSADLGLHSSQWDVDELTLEPDMQVGRYRLLRKLGQGGMGTVYLAHDSRLQRRVAMKFLHLRSRELSRRFIAEAQYTARLQHENIVVVHDAGELSGHPFMVLEYLEGRSLRAILQAHTAHGARAPLPRVAVVDLMIPVVRALQCAHEHGVVHRDLKPENIFVTEQSVVKVLDFGIAKVLLDDHAFATTFAQTVDLAGSELPRTREGTLMGTPLYMSPEQWAQATLDAESDADIDRDIDGRTDLWAVGIMMYEMLAGAHPLAPVTQAKLLAVQDLDTPMPSLAAATPEHGDLAALVDRCLRKPRSQRMASAAELLGALEALGTQHSRPLPGRARATPEPDRASPTDREAREAREIHKTREARETRETRKTRETRETRRLLIGIPLLGACVLLAYIVFDVLFRPGLVIAPVHEPGGVVVAVDRFFAGSDAGAVHGELCAALRQRAPQRTRCIEVPVIGGDDERLVRASRHAGATLVARIDDHGHVRVLFTRPDQVPIPGDLPPIAVPAQPVREQLASVLGTLSRVLAGDLRADPLAVARVDPELAGRQVAAVAWSLAALERSGDSLASSSAIDMAAIRRVLGLCDQGQIPDDDWYCALTRHAYALHCPDCADTRGHLEHVVRHGPASFRDSALLALADSDCRHAPRRALQTLTRFHETWPENDCRRLALVSAATCLITRDRYPADQRDTVAALVQFDPRLLECAPALVATALSERASQYAAAGNWAQAENDWHDAWTRAPRDPYLLNWAEARLHQRSAPVPIDQVVRLVRDRLDTSALHPESRVLAAFLRWAAARDQATAAALLEHHGRVARNHIAVRDRAGTLEPMSCARDRTTIECQVLSLLLRPRDQDTTQALKTLLTADPRPL